MGDDYDRNKNIAQTLKIYIKGRYCTICISFFHHLLFF